MIYNFTQFLKVHRGYRQYFYMLKLDTSPLIFKLAVENRKISETANLRRRLLSYQGDRNVIVPRADVSSGKTGGG